MHDSLFCSKNHLEKLDCLIANSKCGNPRATALAPNKLLSLHDLSKRFNPIPDNSQLRLLRRWRTFFKPAYFFLKRTQKRLLWAISIKRIRQPNHQVRQINQKNMPIKTPITPPDHLLEWICEFNSIILFYAVLSWGNVVNLRTFLAYFFRT